MKYKKPLLEWTSGESQLLSEIGDTKKSREKIAALVSNRRRQLTPLDKEAWEGTDTPVVHQALKQGDAQAENVERLLRNKEDGTKHPKNGFSSSKRYGTVSSAVRKGRNEIAKRKKFTRFMNSALGKTPKKG